jgi:hypothetical protein
MEAISNLDKISTPELNGGAIYEFYGWQDGETLLNAVLSKSSENSDYSLYFNGYIYNYKSLLSARDIIMNLILTHDLNYFKKYE